MARILGRGLAVLLVALLVWQTQRGAPESDFETALREKKKDVWLEVEGPVRKLLPDDTRPPRHQRLLLDMGERRTLLIVHNIDLAPRVPATKGDRLKVRGEFVWNEKGGLIHWTHHDPDGRHAGGWVEHEGKRYE